MARRHRTGRGTRNPILISGATVATIPSGVTVDPTGIDTGGGSMLQFNSGISAWAGTSISLTHGFATLAGISASYQSRGATYPVCVEWQDNGISGAVSAAAYIASYVTKPLMHSGGSIGWTGFGTA